MTPDKKRELIDSGVITGNEACALCEEEATIIWAIAPSPLLLCAEHAQYLGTHLLKDVRSYEIANRVSIKVRMEPTEHR